MPSKRVLTALIGLPLFTLLVFKGSPFIFFLAVLIVALVGQNEFYQIIEKENLHLQKFSGLLMGALLIRGFYYYEDATLILRVILFSLLVILIFRTFSGREVTHAVTEISVTFFGLFYVCFLLGYLILIQREEQGQAWVFFLFLVVWAGDTGAYYAGKLFGKRKLFPKISPKKTIEGAVGGLSSSLIVAVVARSLFFPQYGLVQIAFLGICLGGIGQIGDLAESLLKRSSGCKDSGRLFPGHGGVLDRFDSILFASPVLYYLLWLEVL